jgi:hypothetical protein
MRVNIFNIKQVKAKQLFAWRLLAFLLSLEEEYLL